MSHTTTVTGQEPAAEVAAAATAEANAKAAVQAYPKPARAAAARAAGGVDAWKAMPWADRLAALQTLPPVFSPANSDAGGLVRRLEHLEEGQSLAGAALVDNSGSTGGEILKTLKNFTTKLAPRSVALWNSLMEPMVELHAVNWRSGGGTKPSDIYHPRNFEKVPPGARLDTWAQTKCEERL
eukprot:SAG31_NODE_831_length_11669_cov_3.410026_13_plen_182_part_00